MIQFKEINGKLCIMLEKPVPLTKEAKFPCVVRMIQDDSLIGMHTAQYPETRQRIGIITALDQFGKVVSDGKILYSDAWTGSWFEILGYPVVDGSAEWWWYQMVIGNKICQIHNSTLPNKRYYAIRNGDDYCAFYNNDGTEVHIS